MALFTPVFAVIALICAVWVIYDVLTNNKKLSDGMRVFWIVLALFFSIIAAIVYYLMYRYKK